MTRIKFCGLKTLQDAALANHVKPDAIGFILTPGYRRSISLEQARAIKDFLDPGIKTVGVFVDERIETIKEIAETGLLDMIQLHGSESDYSVEILHRLSGLPVIKAFHIESEEDLEAANHSPATYVLLDAPAPGSGKRFDWSLIQKVRPNWILAGGLNADNVKEAIARLHPDYVDVSSGIETEGSKDLRKMTAFKNAVRKED